MWTKRFVGWSLVFLVTLGPACTDDDQGGNQVPDLDAHAWNPDATVERFRIRQVEPSHGGFAGGTLVTIRGLGFEPESKVFFGDHQADPALVQVPDSSRILCQTPGGPVGPVDVRVVRPDGRQAVLPGGFRYDVFYLDPSSGSTSGGTFVRVLGKDTDFGAGTQVTIGGQQLRDLRVLSPTIVTGRTPPGQVGPATVAITTSDATTYVVEGAFSYYSGTDPVNGGLGGGPIDGELVVHLYDAYTWEPVAGAFVMLGVDPNTPYQAVTGPDGTVTFSDPYLEGPQMVTATAEDYERVSFVAFDAREVTAFMKPFVPPKPGTFPGTAYSAVYGKLRFSDPEQTIGPCAWDEVIPEPEPGWHRVVKVYQTQRSYRSAPLEPGADGTITEAEACDGGFDYFVYTRPGTYAVYALGGHENEDGDFVPYVAGAVRGVTTAPGEMAQVDLHLTVHTDQSIQVSLENPPPLDPVEGPALYRVSLALDLGGDGYVVRRDGVQETTDATDVLLFDHLLPLAGPFYDGNYVLVAEAYNYGQYPYSRLRKDGLLPGDSVQVSGFLGIPRAVTPEPGGELSGSRMVWSEEGAEPTLHVVLVRTYPDGDPFWRLYLPGDVRTFALPDLQGAGTAGGYPGGSMLWHIYAIQIPGLNFDEFTYRYMNERYWTASAAASYLFRFAP